MKTSNRSTIALMAAMAAVLCASPLQAGTCTSCNGGSTVSTYLPLVATPQTTQVYSPPGACLTCAGGQEYKIVYQTVYDKHEMTAWRVENETVYEQRPITTHKPVWETQYREYRYRVSRPVVETSTREERYVVQKPVYETQVRDCSYDRVRWVAETAEREERSIVSRPVYETAEREEVTTVMRPVCQTTYLTQYQTVMQPVTTLKTQLVDQGCYANQMVMKPSPIHNKLAWQTGRNYCDPATGQVKYQPPGLYWEPVQAGRYEVNRVWQPNVVAQQVQQTCMVPQTVAQQVPVNSVAYQPEQIVRKIPYQTCRMVQEEVVRRVPYTVMRPVTERIENKVPYQVCRMVSEEQVRQVPVTTCRVVYEDRVEKQPVQVCRMVATQEMINVPRCVEKRTPVTYNYYTTRVVCARVPLDACGNEIVAPMVPQAEPAAAPVLQEPAAQEPTPAKAPPFNAADQAPALNGSAPPLPPPAVAQPTEQPSRELRSVAPGDGAPPAKADATAAPEAKGTPTEAAPKGPTTFQAPSWRAQPAPSGEVYPPKPAAGS